MTISECYDRVKEYNSGNYVHLDTRNNLLSWSVHSFCILVKDGKNNILKLKLKNVVVKRLINA